ncbi:MAG: SGNH/GDSL hydrolase family protein [Pseudomonadota bacterium]
MDRLVLLGDSVIDNGVYVQPGEPDVPRQLRDLLPGHQVDMRAVDGSVTADVLRDVQENGVPAGARVFLSSGGNDALAHMELLTDQTAQPLAHSLVTLREIREAFRAQYAALLEALDPANLMVATIYNPAFTDDQAPLQVPAEGALSIFNDVIQQEALAHGVPVLDLRRLFDDPGDYANPIEPSAQGGAKIAARVAGWMDDRVSP